MIARLSARLALSLAAARADVPLAIVTLGLLALTLIQIGTAP